MPEQTVIVGWSVAGASLCRALAMLNYRGDITVIDSDIEAPYDRPPLSKEFLRPGGGELVEFDRIMRWGDGTCRTLGGRTVQVVDSGNRTVTLDDGTDISYDKLILATGARARVPMWAKSVGPITLRSVSDARRLRATLADQRRLIIIGGGFIGSEVAAAAAEWNSPVVVIDPLPLPMERLLGSRLAAYLAEQQREHGIGTVYGTAVENLTRVAPSHRANSDEGRSGADTVTATLAEGVEQCGGDVLVAVGAIPNSALVQRNEGVVDARGYVRCNEYGRVDCLDDVWAIGDVASWFHPAHGSYAPSGHWTNAIEQSTHLARTLCSPDTARPYEPVEYFWTDQFGQRYQAVGRIPIDGPVRHIGPAEDGSFGSVWYDGTTGHMTAFAAVGFARQVMLGRRAIARHQKVDEFLAAI